MPDADVACRMMGLRNAKSYSSGYITGGSGRILLDELTCNGDERSLFDCIHNGIGVSNCGHNEDVAVVCERKCFMKECIYSVIWKNEVSKSIQISQGDITKAIYT